MARHARTSGRPRGGDTSRAGDGAFGIFIEPTSDQPGILIETRGIAAAARSTHALEGPLAALKASGRLRNAGGFTGGARALRKVYFAAEDGVVFNRETEGADIALDRAAGA